MGKERVVAYSKVLFRYVPGKNEENTKDLSQDKRSPGRVLNPGPPKYEARVLTAQTQSLV